MPCALPSGQVSHLEALGAAPSLVTTQWLLTIFVGSALPLNALLSIWDAFFRERSLAYLFRVAAALLVASRGELLRAADAGDAFKVLSAIGSELHEQPAIDALLHAAATLRAGDALEPENLSAARREHAARIEHERGLHASQVACAAVATATATASEVAAAATDGRAAPAASGTLHARTGWTVVPAACSAGASSLDDGAALEAGASLEGWNLVEKQELAAELPLSAFSYVILQHEQPNVHEAHFARAPSADEPQQPSAPPLVPEEET